MCDLCTDDPQKLKDAIKRHEELADDMAILSHAYKLYAHGKVNPHEAFPGLEQAAKRVAIELVSNW